MISYSVGITGLNAMDDPVAGIPVTRSIRSAKEWGGRIIALAYDALDTGIYDSGLLDEVYLLPYPSEGENALLQRLKQILEKTSIDVIIPTVDSELVNFCRLEPELKELGINLLLPPEDKIRLHRKERLREFCQANGICAPKTITITEPAELKKAGKELGFPLVVKGAVHEAALAYSEDEALVHYQRIKAAWGLPLVAQEYIPGEEYTVIALGDRDGNLVGMVETKKLRVTEKGKSWAGVTVWDEELMAVARGILEKLRWVGPLELEFRKRSSSKEYYLFELNPRFPVGCYLAARAGQNLPLATVQLAMGEKVEPFTSYRAGVMYTRHAVDVISPLEYMEDLVTRGELIFDRKRKKNLERS